MDERWPKRARQWGWLFALGLAIGIGALFLWSRFVLSPMPEVASTLVSDAHVRVERSRGWWVFRPTADQPQVGLILYPGGGVDPRAYAPVARAIAGMGFRVVIVPMPLSLAVLAPDRAGAVIAAYPEVEHWAIGGHSLGGAMAARYAYRHQDAVKGLVLWAAYPAPNNDLSPRDLVVVSVYGSDDGLATPLQIAASRPRLPSTTQWVEIEGGNHAQFGWYGAQRGDHQASISRKEQQRQVVEATVKLLQQLGPILP